MSPGSRLCLCLCLPPLPGCVSVFRGLAIYFAQVLISGKFPTTISFSELPLRFLPLHSPPRGTSPRLGWARLPPPLGSSINYPKMATWLYLGHCVWSLCGRYSGSEGAHAVRVKVLIYCAFLHFAFLHFHFM